MVSYRLEVFLAGVPRVCGGKSRPQSPRQYFGQHVLEVVVLGFAVGLVVHPVVHRQAAAFYIGVIQRHQAQAFDHPVVLARPKMPHQLHLLAVRFVQRGVIHL